MASGKYWMILTKRRDCILCDAENEFSGWKKACMARGITTCRRLLQKETFLCVNIHENVHLDRIVICFYSDET